MHTPEETFNPGHEDPKDVAETLIGLAEEDELPYDERDEKIKALTDERDATRDQLLRSLAEFQTFRRRTLNEKDETRKYGNQELAESLLPILDNFERTVKALEADADIEAIMQGVGMIEKQLRSALDAANVKRISSVGEVFDPFLHEALEAVTTEEFEPNVVVEEVEPGYRLHDRVIRPAKVRVAQAP